MGCELFGHRDRPQFCNDLKAQPEMCGDTAGEALRILERWERETEPASPTKG